MGKIRDPAYTVDKSESEGDEGKRYAVYDAIYNYVHCTTSSPKEEA